MSRRSLSSALRRRHRMSRRSLSSALHRRHRMSRRCGASPLVQHPRDQPQEVAAHSRCRSHRCRMGDHAKVRTAACRACQTQHRVCFGCWRGWRRRQGQLSQQLTALHILVLLRVPRRSRGPLAGWRLQHCCWGGLSTPGGKGPRAARTLHGAGPCRRGAVAVVRVRPGRLLLLFLLRLHLLHNCYCGRRQNGAALRHSPRHQLRLPPRTA
jgi:hypothetical protein